jgi:hypothetical protein
MVRHAMTPMSESDRYCVWWLNRYFEIHGDKAPNSEEVAMNNGCIKEQFR